MKAMTQKMALAEARRRWGEDATTTYRPNAIGAEERAAILAKPREQRTREERTDSACSWRCTLGVSAMGMFNVVRGQGDTWESAFAAADAAEARERERDRWMSRPV